MASQLFDQLNPEQKKAVQVLEGPVLVIAGAGSGKTRTIVHRMAYLIEERGIPSARILGVTFTNKAAAEMRIRITELLTPNFRRSIPFLGTFHAFGVRVLRRDAAVLGYQPNFVIYDYDDQLALVRRAMQELHVDPKQFQPTLLHHLISGAKNLLLLPAEFASRAEDEREKVAARVYAGYQTLLRESNAVDFDDLIMLPARLFQENPKVLAQYQDLFHYIMVDEYQDTNHAQYTMVRLLAEKRRNLYVVGDDWQAIYGWRGANLENILRFGKDYPDAQIIRLEQNYRSTQNILSAAQAIIKKNKGQLEKSLWTENGDGEKVTVCETLDERSEAQFVAMTIRNILTAQSEPRTLAFKDFAILYRTHAQSRALEEALIAASITYKIVGGIRFYERKEIKDIMAYLYFISNPADTVNLLRVINAPARKIGESTLAKVMSFARQMNCTVSEALARSAEIPGIQPMRQLILKNFSDAMEQLRASSTALGIPALIDQIMSQSGYEKALRDGTEEAEVRYENIQELKTVASHFKDLASFLENVALLTQDDEVRADANAVTLMTFHSAKGLEFNTVFVCGLEEGVFPHTRSLLEDPSLSEERRLAYVAMTRAKERLYLLHAAMRNLYGQTLFNSASRFVAEIPLDFREHLSWPEDQSDVTVDSEDPFSDDVEQEALAIGDRIAHPQLGEGIVIDLDDDIAEIDFVKAGRKKIAFGYIPLRKMNHGS